MCNDFNDPKAEKNNTAEVACNAYTKEPNVNFVAIVMFQFNSLTRHSFGIFTGGAIVSIYI